MFTACPRERLPVCVLFRAIRTEVGDGRVPVQLRLAKWQIHTGNVSKGGPGAEMPYWIAKHRAVEDTRNVLVSLGRRKDRDNAWSAGRHPHPRRPHFDCMWCTCAKESASYAPHTYQLPPPSTHRRYISSDMDRLPYSADECPMYSTHGRLIYIHRQQPAGSLATEVIRSCPIGSSCTRSRGRKREDTAIASASRSASAAPS